MSIDPQEPARDAETEAPKKKKTPFFLTISQRDKVDDDGKEIPADRSPIMLWSSVNPAREQTLALATIGFDESCGAEIVLCGLKSQEDMAERVMTRLARVVTQGRKKGAEPLSPSKNTLIRKVSMSDGLAPSRGFLLTAPSCFPEGAFPPGPSHPLWAIPLWPSEVEAVSAMGLAGFLKAASEAGLDLLDLERPSLTGETVAARSATAAEAAAASAFAEACEQARRMEAGDTAEPEPDRSNLKYFRAFPDQSAFVGELTKGFCGVGASEVILACAPEQKQELAALRDLLDGFLDGEHPELRAGLTVGPYGELPGARGKKGFYFMPPPPDFSAVLAEKQTPTLWAIPATEAELLAAGSMDRKAFQALMGAQGAALFDLNRPELDLTGAPSPANAALEAEKA